MRKFAKLLSIMLLVCGLMCISCKPDPDTEPGPNPNPTTVAAPTNLNVTDISLESAKLTWTGIGTSYELQVGTTTYTSTSTSYNVTGLQENTEYTWKVRARKGDDFSAWTNGHKFKTAAKGNKCLVRFKKLTADPDKVVAEMSVDNESGQRLAHHVFGVAAGTSDYVEIPARNHTPRFLFRLPIFGVENRGLCLWNPSTYNFETGYQYTIVCVDQDVFYVEKEVLLAK